MREESGGERHTRVSKRGEKEEEGEMRKTEGERNAGLSERGEKGEGEMGRERRHI